MTAFINVLITNHYKLNVIGNKMYLCLSEFNFRFLMMYVCAQQFNVVGAHVNHNNLTLLGSCNNKTCNR